MNEYQEKLKSKMDEYAHLVYRLTKNFPKEELYGTTSQIRRAALSVVLNYIEGCARRKTFEIGAMLWREINNLRKSVETIKQ